MVFWGSSSKVTIIGIKSHFKAEKSLPPFVSQTDPQDPHFIFIYIWFTVFVWGVVYCGRDLLREGLLYQLCKIYVKPDRPSRPSFYIYMHQVYCVCLRGGLWWARSYKRGTTLGVSNIKSTLKPRQTLMTLILYLYTHRFTVFVCFRGQLTPPFLLGKPQTWGRGDAKYI